MGSEEAGNLPIGNWLVDLAAEMSNVMIGN